jgi:glucosyl-dolichyl phosphate glucuronosyltransferase
VITGTIAVCTRNRAAILPQCLASLAGQLAGPDQIETLVVDNGSSDSTAGVLREWEQAGAGRRVVTEPVAGLSRARNAALEAAKGDVVLFVDDDALVPPTWARAHLAAYEDLAVGMAGGPIGLVWPAGRPDWLGDDLLQWYSILEQGDDVRPFPGDHGPYGTNMSVRRAAALDAGGFDPQLGRIGNRLLSGEEPDLTRRLTVAGWSVLYVPAAAVVQQVLPERLGRRWLLRRGWGQGLTNARLGLAGDRLAGVRPRRRERWRRAVAEARESAACLAARKEPDRDELGSLVLAVVHAGSAAELARATFAREQGP